MLAIHTALGLKRERIQEEDHGFPTSFCAPIGLHPPIICFVYNTHSSPCGAGILFSSRCIHNSFFRPSFIWRTSTNSHLRRRGKPRLTNSCQVSPEPMAQCQRLSATHSLTKRSSSFF